MLLKKFLFILIIILNLIVCDRKHKEIAGPNSTSFPAAPGNIVAKVGDGRIVFTWEMENSSNINCYFIYRKDIEAAEMSLIDSCFTKQYTDSTAKNGVLYYFQFSAVDSQGYEGKPSTAITAKSNIFDIIIENGEEYTNSQSVTLKLTASLETQYMLIANDSSFTDAAWEAYAQTRSWTLTSRDGEKNVYANFRDYESNETQLAVSDKIILDSQAIIKKVTENTTGQTKIPGDTIHFVLIAGEIGGEASIDIGNEVSGINLFDDGTNGDSVANDSTYEINYIIPSGLEAVNAIITGHFTDRVNNVASDITAPGRVTIQQKPAAVTLYSPTPVGSSLTTLSLSWSKNEDTDFASYQVFRSKTAGVSDSTSSLIRTITDQSTINDEDLDLQEDTEYFYRIYVYDTGGLSSGSNEESGRTNKNESPTAVILFPPVPVSGSLTSLNLRWSQNNDSDFAGYKIFREEASGVDSSSALIHTISTQSTTNYEDTNLQENTTYYYRVYVYDSGGLSAGSDEKSGTTNTNEAPAAVTLAEPAVVDSVTLRLSWSRNSDDDFSMYTIYRSTILAVDTTNAPVAIINEQQTTQYDDLNLITNTLYYYRLFVTDKGGLSAGSNVVSGTPKP